MKNERVCVVGLGYIGLPTATIIASHGYQVLGVDVSQRVVDTINAGKVHIIEPDLDAFVRAVTTAGNLKADIKPAEADIFLLCVPTPFLHDESHEVPQPDLSYIEKSTRAIAPFVRPGNIVILESTSPVGTTEYVAKILAEEGAPVDELHIAYCPERVLPGKIMIELIANDRIVGGMTPEAAEAVRSFYSTFVRGDILVTNSRTAEMAKLVENSYRDVNIAFANELSLLCDPLEIDVWELIRLANRHPRVNILQPGAGVGGHCIAVDPWFIVARDPENARLIRRAREVNNYKTEWVVEKIVSTARKFELDNGRPPKVATLGLAFKPDIDDLRESPALEIALRLEEELPCVLAVEPHVQSHPKLQLTEALQAVDSADIIVVLVKHKVFNYLDLSGKQVLDFCGHLANR